MCFGPSASSCMLLPALTLVPAWILVLPMILELACELVEAQSLARACMPPPACMLLPTLILVPPVILMLAIELINSRGSRAGLQLWFGVDNQRVPLFLARQSSVSSCCNPISRVKETIYDQPAELDRRPSQLSSSGLISLMPICALFQRGG